MISVLPSSRAIRRAWVCGESGLTLITRARFQTRWPASFSAASLAPAKFGIRPLGAGESARRPRGPSPSRRPRTWSLVRIRPGDRHRRHDGRILEPPRRFPAPITRKAACEPADLAGATDRGTYNSAAGEKLTTRRVRARLNNPPEGLIAVAAALTWACSCGRRLGLRRRPEGPDRPGVTIGGVDIGGRDADSARKIIKSEVVAPEAAGRRQLRRRGLHLSARSASRPNADVDGMVDEAIDRREGSLFDRVPGTPAGGEVDDDLEPRVDYSESAVNDFVTPRSPRKINREDPDATVPSGSRLAEAGRAKLALREAGDDDLINEAAQRPAAIAVRRSSRRPIPRSPRRSSPRRTRRTSHRPIELHPAPVQEPEAEESTRSRSARVATTPRPALRPADQGGQPHLARADLGLGGAPWPARRSAGAGNLWSPAGWGSTTGPASTGPETGSLGSAASHGCIRMAVDDVIELFDQVEVGDPVYIQ